MVQTNLTTMRFVSIGKPINCVICWNQKFSLQLKSLVDRFGDGPGMQLLTMTLRTVAANVEWISRSHSTIYNWVEGNYS